MRASWNGSRPAEKSRPRRAGGTPWKALLANRMTALLCAMYFTQSYGFNFYVTWLPTYLKNVRGFGSVSLGVFAGLPLTLSVLAVLLGGIATDRLARRFGLRVGRATVGGAGLLAAGACLMAGTFTASPLASAVLIAFGGASANFMLPAAWGACVDMGGAHAGTLSGAMNTSGQIGGVLSPLIVGVLRAVVRLLERAPLSHRRGCMSWAPSVWAWIDPSRRLAECA